MVKKSFKGFVNRKKSMNKLNNTFNVAAAGPVGTGVAAVITAATAKWAVENGIRRINLGKDIAGWNWNYTINVP